MPLMPLVPIDMHYCVFLLFTDSSRYFRKMTISYTLDVSQTTIRSFFKLLFRWRGSVWKAVIPQLIIWTLTYLIISAVYRFVLKGEAQETFASWVRYLDADLSHYIPLSFLLGFFVSQVVSRWHHIIDGG